MFLDEANPIVNIVDAEDTSVKSKIYNKNIDYMVFTDSEAITAKTCLELCPPVIWETSVEEKKAKDNEQRLVS